MKNLLPRLFAVTTFMLLFSLTIQAGVDTSALLVKTAQGLVKGTTSQGICIWKGIPYAKAPVGNLRFRDPQPADNWTGVKDATAFGPVALQMKRVLIGNEKQSEDCLFLNVWSPAADGKKRPVMVWIHGGGFVGGSGSQDLYDGAQLSKKGDLVIVSMNYRLGPLGFLYFNDLPGSKGNFDSNLGIKDQVAALKWVKENIAAFGGDPAQVTIFGESAGGISVETLMSIPATQGLFKRAIVESGPAGDVWSPVLATRLTNIFLKELNISTDSLSKLRNVPADSISTAMLRLMKAMKADPTLPKTCAPTVDGSYIPHDLLTAIQSGQSKGVDLLIGTNKDEANLFAMKRLKMAPINEEQLKPYMVRFKAEDQNKLKAAYKGYPSKSSILALITDGIFTMPSARFAELQSAHANTYMYRFDWASKPIKAVGLGACHGIELPFVFGSFNTKLGKKILLFADTKRIHELSNEIQQDWINFARTGNPNNPGTDNWKKYEPSVRTTLIFDKKNYTCTDPNCDQRKAWGTLNIFE